MKKNLPTIILVVILIAGVTLLLYPSVADYWNSKHQSRAIANYSETVNTIPQENYDAILNAAHAYNTKMAARGNLAHLNEADRKEYEKQLSIDDSGMMGYIEIKTIRCYLPIYHGTADEVLNSAIGHIEGSSLPVGGEGTHCVLSGHRGLPSAKLFSELDKLVMGDKFVIRVLNEILTYEVDQIRIVLPEEVDDLRIVPGKDYCTLVTCTPYGVNSHRLLVRGHRVPNESADIMITSEAVLIDRNIVAAFIGGIILILIFLFNLVKNQVQKRRRMNGTDEAFASAAESGTGGSAADEGSGNVSPAQDSDTGPKEEAAIWKYVDIIAKPVNNVIDRILDVLKRGGNNE